MAVYVVDRHNKITVNSDGFVGKARNAAGNYVPAVPEITITADFYGEWEDDDQLYADMQECIEKLQEAFDAHVSGRNNYCGNDGDNDRKKNRFGKFF